MKRKLTFQIENLHFESKSNEYLNAHIFFVKPNTKKNLMLLIRGGTLLDHLFLNLMRNRISYFRNNEKNWPEIKNKITN